MGTIVGMLDVAECERIAISIYESRGLDPERPPAPARLYRELFGRVPVAVPNLPREALSGVLDGEVVIRYRAGLSEARARFVCSHEAGHRVLGSHHGGLGLVEARADLLAACLLVPRPAFEAMVKRVGHSVYDLAHAFTITQAAAMLRLGEVTGRPVRLLGPRERTRGDAFEWDRFDAKAALTGRLRKTVHPVRLRDEGKWGLMAAG